MTILFIVVCDGAHDAVFVYAQLRIIEEGARDRTEQLGFTGFETVALEAAARAVGNACRRAASP